MSWNSIRLKIAKKNSMQNPVKILGYIKCYSLLKTLAILSDTTVRRFAVDQKDLKPYWK